MCCPDLNLSFSLYLLRKTLKLLLMAIVRTSDLCVVESHAHTLKLSFGSRAENSFETVEDVDVICALISQDLGLEGSSLNDILYKNAAFLNLVDPISHDLLLSLAREMQCPKKVSFRREWLQWAHTQGVQCTGGPPAVS